ncbi:MAG TPA: hypothetical protein PLX17_03925 [Chitinophagaceae bacterium]|nr:hypothetical protein [Chitinophagaceae bacterium]HQV54635.1 hypothetical protein [Chitinophagaceae bacterium]HQX96158.1 hypothetical protein [Chitinophagaceae bacterium]
MDDNDVIIDIYFFVLDCFYNQAVVPSSLEIQLGKPAGCFASLYKVSPYFYRNKINCYGL